MILSLSQVFLSQKGILTLVREYPGGDGMDEDKNFAVVYNSSVRRTYDVMQKHTEQEVHDHIRRYGIGRASEEVKEVARIWRRSSSPPCRG